MLFFESDYTEGAHEQILRRLAETNLEHNGGYGSDSHCQNAKEKIRQACSCPEAEIFFLSGGTQTNAIAIASVLRSYEGVIAAETGHVSVHEAGAIEHTGHKVLELPGHEGKIWASELKAYLQQYWQDENFEHMVAPGMVYISHPTEYGTLYSEKELRDISSVCREYHIPLYADGARLGYGLMSRETDVTLPGLAQYCDLFYIGGTKVGALFGEALVFTGKNMPRHFLSMVKQKGALLAKGWLLGLQFETLFTDDLYLKMGAHGIEMAELLKKGLKDKGIPFYLESPTNQQFVILENERMKALAENVRFSFWEKLDEAHTIVRFATSWATKKEDVEALLELF